MQFESTVHKTASCLQRTFIPYQARVLNLSFLSVPTVLFFVLPLSTTRSAGKRI